MVKIDPVTRQRFTHAPHIGDMILEANSQDDVLDEENVVVIGPWTDNNPDGDTVTGGPPSRQQMMWGGHANELFGTDAWVETGADLDNLNVTGKSADTHRRRKKWIYKRFD